MKYFEVLFRLTTPDNLRQDVSDVLAAMAGECGFETFEENEEGLIGYVQQDLFDETALNNVLQLLPFGEEQGVSISYEVSEAPDRDWNEQWEQEGFEPITVGTHLIIYDGRHLPTLSSDPAPLSDSSPLTSESPPLTVKIEARQAFGTGNHATTRMMCQALMDLGMQGLSLLDCGTGTGILGIVALKLGAIAAPGYDIDQWRVENARHNAELNGVGMQFTSVYGNANIIRQLQRKFDVVAANINRNILLADMPLMRQALPQYRGVLLLSGFYHEDVPMLVEKAVSLGFHLEYEKQEDGWSMLQFRIN